MNRFLVSWFVNHCYMFGGLLVRLPGELVGLCPVGFIFGGLLVRWLPGELVG